MTDTTVQATRADSVRRWVVLVSMVIAIVGSLIGSGALGGTPIAEVAGGALSANATLIAPAVPAFSIWSVIYLGLVAYAVWQLLPAQRSDARQRRLGYPIAASLILNAAWILSVQAGMLAVSVVVILLLLIVLAWTFRLSLLSRPQGWVEATLVDGTVGLYLGWVCVATAANVTAGLVAAGFTGWSLAEDTWAVVVLAVAGIVGILLALAGRGRLGPTASLAWGLVWVSVARLSGAPHSVTAGVTALVTAVLIVLVTVAVRVVSELGRHRRAATVTVRP